jgi:CRISPR/Cas system-associated exonuclease Cas4 (RecB family)
MKEINLTDYLRGEKRERKLNRFSVSELYYLLAGWTTVEEYLKGKEFTIKNLWEMKLGELKHQWIQDFLKKDYECEIKKVYKVDDLEIVGKADLIAKDHGIEIKTGKARDKASRSQEFQARMYCTIFEKPVFYIMQPYHNHEKAYLKTIGVVHRNDKWFETQINKIKLKYQEIKNYEII